MTGFKRKVRLAFQGKPRIPYKCRLKYIFIAVYNKSPVFHAHCHLQQHAVA